MPRPFNTERFRQQASFAESVWDLRPIVIPEFVKPLPEKRICQHGTCRTVLSQSNKGSVCRFHKELLSDLSAEGEKDCAADGCNSLAYGFDRFCSAHKVRRLVYKGRKAAR